MLLTARFQLVTTPSLNRALFGCPGVKAGIPKTLQVFGAVQPSRLFPAAASLLKKISPTLQLCGIVGLVRAGFVETASEKSTFFP
jgi:hypothetical protein